MPTVLLKTEQLNDTRLRISDISPREIDVDPYIVLSTVTEVAITLKKESDNITKDYMFYYNADNFDIAIAHGSVAPDTVTSNKWATSNEVLGISIKTAEFESGSIIIVLNVNCASKEAIVTQLNTLFGATTLCNDELLSGYLTASTSTLFDSNIVLEGTEDVLEISVYATNGADTIGIRPGTYKPTGVSFPLTNSTAVFDIYGWNLLPEITEFPEGYYEYQISFDGVTIGVEVCNQTKHYFAYKQSYLYYVQLMLGLISNCDLLYGKNPICIDSRYPATDSVIMSKLLFEAMFQGLVEAINIDNLTIIRDFYSEILNYRNANPL